MVDNHPLVREYVQKDLVIHISSVTHNIESYFINIKNGTIIPVSRQLLKSSFHNKAALRTMINLTVLKAAHYNVEPLFGETI